ncbi:YggT family protein [Uliginosibacterium sp. 31-16]|uniref:YggT family protein n=1 Tax=Uliginosibacterium sp. 31-16 TaxID=3068315 RepID=UPI00273EB36B|nr:YggT family protein [Uliginosibacterium sp. 31-16]MDP5238099.1 YggT family protein [Uliginosibacterium sp. 31-16]
MLLDILSMILSAVFGFFTMLLLVRTAMRFMRISFVSQLGQFVLATTNWAVLPFQKIVPSIGKLDLSALLPAWLLQALLALLLALLGGHSLGQPLPLMTGVLIIGAFELLRSALYLLLGVVLLGAILSWVNPYSPFAGPINALTRPFLAPFRRILPPISGVDLSPLLLLLVLQILLYMLNNLQGGVARLLFV